MSSILKVDSSKVTKTVKWGAPYTAATLNSIVTKAFGHGFVLSGFELLKRVTTGSAYTLQLSPGSFVSNGVIVEITESQTIAFTSEPSSPLAIIAFTENEKDPEDALNNSDSGVYLQIVAIRDVYPGHAVIGTIIPATSDYKTNDYAANEIEARYMPAPHHRIDELVNDLKGGISGFDTLSPSRGQLTEVYDDNNITVGHRAELKYSPANIELENMLAFANGVYQAPGTGYAYESGGTYVQKNTQDFPLFQGSIAEDSASASYLVSPDIVFQKTAGFSAAGSTEVAIPPSWKDEVAYGRVSVIVFANGLIMDPDYYEYSANRHKIIIKAPYDQVAEESDPLANTDIMVDEEETPIASVTLVGVRGLVSISKVAQGYSSVPVVDLNGKKVLKNQDHSTSYAGQRGYHAEKGGGLGPWASVPKVGLPLSAPGSTLGQNDMYPIKQVVHNLANNATNLGIFHFENDAVAIEDWPQGSLHSRIPYFASTGSLQVFVDGRAAHTNHPVMDEIVGWEFKNFKWPRGFYVRERNSNFFDLSIRPLKGTFTNYVDYADEDEDQFPKQEWDLALESKIWDPNGSMSGGHTLANKVIVLQFDNAGSRSNMFIENQQVPNSLCASTEFANTSACKAFLDTQRIRIDGTPSQSAVASQEEFPMDSGFWNTFMTRGALTGEAPSEMTGAPGSTSITYDGISNTMWALGNADYLDAVSTIFSFAQAAKNAGRLHYDPVPPSGLAGLLSDANQLVGTNDVPINSSGQQIGFMGGDSKTQYGAGETNASQLQADILTNASGSAVENAMGKDNPIVTLGGLDNYLTPMIKSMGFNNRFLNMKFDTDENNRIDFSKLIDGWGKWVGGQDIPDDYSLLEVLNAIYNAGSSGYKQTAIMYGGIHTERMDGGTNKQWPSYQSQKRYKDGYVFISLETGSVKIPSSYGGYGWISGHINFDKPDSAGIPSHYKGNTHGDGIHSKSVQFGGVTHKTFGTNYSSGAPVWMSSGMSVAYKGTPLMAFISPGYTTVWPGHLGQIARPQAFPAPIWNFTQTKFATNQKELAVRIDAKHVPGFTLAEDYCLSYPIHFMIMGSASDPRYINNSEYPTIFKFTKPQGGKDVITPEDGITW